MPNRLAFSSSPYLLQHKDNPVDWHPWGEEAFAKARDEDKPVFLSIGYSSCHWCHVMAHESFEDPEIAAILNKDFVSIKVDREEMPEVDDAYMTAVQLSTGRGGWPMSIFLTPERKPFFGGTYFPKDDYGDRPGFKSVLRQVVAGWQNQRAMLDQMASDFSQELSIAVERRSPFTEAKLDQELLDNAVRLVASQFDENYGGFGTGAKFPPHTTISFLLEYAASPSAPEEMAQTALGLALATLEAMALGGIHDHVGGGFHRYTVDEAWVLPHFEKMLYDNALMLGNYAKATALTMGSDTGLAKLFARAMGGIVTWLNREMGTQGGLYGSALNADSEGEEGKFYTWTASEVRDLLGDRAEAFMSAYSFKEEGNYHDEATQQLTGKNIPHLQELPTADFADDLDKLLKARLKRPHPSFDNKEIVGWNGLLISSLALCGEIDASVRMAEAIQSAEAMKGQLPRLISNGNPSGDAYLDDYAALILGLLDISDALQEAGDSAGSNQWREEADRLCARMVELFYDDEGGGFYYTSSEHENLFGRYKPVFDQPAPSGNALAVQALLLLGDNDRAQKCLQASLGWMERAPHATLAMLTNALWFVQTEGPPPLRLVESPAPTPIPKGHVQVRLESTELHAGRDGRASGKVMFEIPTGFHINSSNPPAKWLIPTALSFEPLTAEAHFPDGEEDKYTGSLEVPFEISLGPNQLGSEFEVKVSFQACTDSECLQPEEKTLSGVVTRT